MKKRTLFLSIIAPLLLSGCKAIGTTTGISDLNMDFPISKKLELKFVNKYEVFSRIHTCFADDSVLWVVNDYNNEENLGYCFDLNSGTQLSVLGNVGKAAYEFMRVHKILLDGDSIQFHTETDAIRTYAKRDIVDNIPMPERKFSLTAALDSVFAVEKIKLRNGSVLVTMHGGKYSRGAFSDNSSDQYHNSALNSRMVALIDDSIANSFQTVDYKKFDLEIGAHPELEHLDHKIKSAFATSHIGLKGNDMAVFSLWYLPLLYTFDLNSKKVVKEKLYSELLTDRFGVINEMRLRNLNVKCNDKYIVCYINGFLTKEDKETRTFKNTILVFDWDLNPVKRFDVPCSGGTNDPYFISEDCRSVYHWKSTDEGLVLSKAELSY